MTVWSRCSSAQKPFPATSWPLLALSCHCTLCGVQTLALPLGGVHASKIATRQWCHTSGITLMLQHNNSAASSV